MSDEFQPYPNTETPAPAQPPVNNPYAPPAPTYAPPAPTYAPYTPPENYNVQPGQPEKPHHSGFAIASMVLGIVSLVCCCAGNVTAILGLIFGILALTKTKKDGMALAGVITSSVAIVLSIVTIAVSFTPGFRTAMEEWWNDDRNSFSNRYNKYSDNRNTDDTGNAGNGNNGTSFPNPWGDFGNDDDFGFDFNFDNSAYFG